MRWLSGCVVMVVFASGGCRSRNEAPSTEPRIVLRDSEGRELTAADLREVQGPVPFELVGGTSVPAEAKRLHQRAREAGARGDYAEALGLLRSAQELAPEWPYPVYDAAFTLLLQKDYEAALAAYEETIGLAPRGFFTAITAAHTLKRERDGELPVGTYAGYVALEWVSDRAAHDRAVREMTEKLPSFAPGWFRWANTLEDPRAKLDAIERGLGAGPDRETLGILLVNKALALERSGRREAAIELLTNTALDPASTLATEHMAKLSLAQLL